MRNIYRAFRTSIISESYKPSLRRDVNYQFEKPHPIRKLRQKIIAVREYLASNGAQMISENLALETFVRTALRIPVDVPLLPTRVARICHRRFLFTPISVVVHRAKSLLQEIGSHEGRSLVFELQIKHTLPDRHRFFGPAIDFALRELQAPNNREVFRDMHFFDVNWMRACYRLGVRQMEEVDRICKMYFDHKVDGALVLVLVDLCVIDSVATLAQLPQRRGWCSHDYKISQDDVWRFRQVVQYLKDAGARSYDITQLLKLDVKNFDPQQLKATLGILEFNGPEFSILFEALGELVVRVEPERWTFLKEELGICLASDIEHFKHFIGSGRTPNKAFALALRAAGAVVADLAACQQLILAVGDRTDEKIPVPELHLLMGTPHSLTFAQVAAAEDYLLVGLDLAAYLQVLIRHGFGDAHGVLAFQRCYKQLQAGSLDHWLNIAGATVKGLPASKIVDWTVLAGKGGYFDAFDYLLQVGELRTFDHLHQALKLAPLGAPLLRYVREDRGIKGLTALRQWYYSDAPGITNVRLWSELNAVSKALLDDAFDRKNFTLLKGNLECVDALISQRIDAELGRFPGLSDELTKYAYHQTRRQMNEQIGVKIAPKLRILLNETGGILLQSLLIHIDSPEVLREKITLLKSELPKLLTAGGPAGQNLSDLDVDLIAIVYRTTSNTVRNFWPHVIGRESDIAKLNPGFLHPMRWDRTEYQLNAPLNSKGLLSVHEALQFAVRFVTRQQEDMHEACRNLKPRQLDHPAIDVRSLALHLGVLMAIAAEDLNVRYWLEQGDKMIGQMSEAGPLVHQHIESLHELFDVQLEDALEVLTTGFVDGLTEDDAVVLASRLDKHIVADVPLGKNDLKIALVKTRGIVLKVFRRWTVQQKKRIGQKDVTGAYTQMQAYISKWPAAFFAKHAANICTANNVDMWQEKRLAHLLVFAPDQQRLAGMAYLYFERIRELDLNRDTLVIRAINPMSDVLASHNISSIVDSYFDVAIQIARNNGLAAVAFPAPIGMHLMSNHEIVEKDIRDRFMKHVKTFATWDVEKSLPYKVDTNFYAYESGATLVNELYVIWHIGENEQPTSSI